jgi:hypothetical protein
MSSATKAPFIRKMSQSELKMIVPAERISKISAGDAPLTDYNDDTSSAWVLQENYHKFFVKQLSNLGTVYFDSATSIIPEAYDTYFVNDNSICLTKDEDEYFFEICSPNNAEFSEIYNIITEMIGKDLEV